MMLFALLTNLRFRITCPAKRCLTSPPGLVHVHSSPISQCLRTLSLNVPDSFPLTFLLFSLGASRVAWFRDRRPDSCTTPELQRQSEPAPLCFLTVEKTRLLSPCHHPTSSNIISSCFILFQSCLVQSYWGVSLCFSVHLTLEQHVCELCGSDSTSIFFQ